MRGREAFGGDIAGFTEVQAMVGPKWGAPGLRPGREKGRKVRLGECFWLVQRANKVADLLVVKSEQIHYKVLCTKKEMKGLKVGVHDAVATATFLAHPGEDEGALDARHADRFMM